MEKQEPQEEGERGHFESNVLSSQGLGRAVGRVLKPMVQTKGKGAAILDHSIFLFNDNNVSRKILC